MKRDKLIAQMIQYGFESCRVEEKLDPETNIVFHKFGFTKENGNSHTIGLYAEPPGEAQDILYASGHDNYDLQPDQKRMSFSAFWNSVGSLDELIKANRFLLPQKYLKQNKK